MRNIQLLIAVLLVGLNLAAQNLKELESDLAHTIITDTKEVKKKADRIFEIDPFNEVATYYLVESYRYTDNDSLIPNFFQEKISVAPENPIPYLLSAKYQYVDFSISDTARIIELKKALNLEPRNFEANYLLGVSYYQLFNERLTSDSTSKSIFYALQSRNYFLTTVSLDSITILYLRYPVIQLSFYLNDSKTAMLYEQMDYSPEVDEKNFPKQGQFYFPINRFVELENGWETSYKTDVLRAVDLTTFILDWYSGQLKALNEPLLFNQIEDTVYRFTWLRTFHHPVAIRIQKEGGNIILSWKMSDGAGGYSPGELTVSKTKKLNNTEWNEFQKLLTKADYWSLPTNEQSDIMGNDGSQWIIEGIENGKYNVVNRWTPRESDYQEIGKYLIKLTDLKIPKGDLY